MSVPVRIRLTEDAAIPVYGTADAAGADISSASSADITIQPGESAAIPTGIYAEIPQGYELQVRPRSGLALRHAVTVLNTPGTIDADYRGEIRVILINHGRSPFTVHKGDRIAQVVLAPALRADFTAADSLSQTERGAGGFGSTGV